MALEHKQYNSHMDELMTLAPLTLNHLNYLAHGLMA